MQPYYPRLLLTVLTVVAFAAPVQALTVCQDTCNSQHLNTVNTLWQAPRPATATPTVHQQQVMAAVNTLNKCMADCAAGTMPAPVNLALNKTAVATRQESGYAATKAVDGDAASYWWAKSTSTHSLKVDLGASVSVSKVSLVWGSYYARNYQVQTSTDDSNWTTVVSITSATGDMRDHAFTTRTARYVRISCSRAGSSNGYAIKELSVFE